MKELKKAINESIRCYEKELKNNLINRNYNGCEKSRTKIEELLGVLYLIDKIENK